MKNRKKYHSSHRIIKNTLEKNLIMLNLIADNKFNTNNYTYNRIPCMITGKKRGVNLNLKLSRIPFRLLSDNGNIPGIQRASW